MLRCLQEIQPDFVEEAKVLSWAVDPRKQEEEEEERKNSLDRGYEQNGTKHFPNVIFS
jgi:hypothetical protein